MSSFLAIVRGPGCRPNSKQRWTESVAHCGAGAARRLVPGSLVLVLGLVSCIPTPPASPPTVASVIPSATATVVVPTSASTPVLTPLPAPAATAVVSPAPAPTTAAPVTTPAPPVVGARVHGYLFVEAQGAAIPIGQAPEFREKLAELPQAQQGSVEQIRPGCAGLSSKSGDGGHQRPVVSLIDGSFFFPVQPPGSYQLCWGKAGHPPGLRAVPTQPVNRDGVRGTSTHAGG